MIHNNAYIPSLEHQLEAQNLRVVNVATIALKEIKRVNLEHQKERLATETDKETIIFLKQDIYKLENYGKLSRI
jgi:hypothetical protein